MTLLNVPSHKLAVYVYKDWDMCQVNMNTLTLCVPLSKHIKDN